MITTAQTLAKARTLHQSGQLKEAEALYQLILISEPKHAEALALLGTIDLQCGRLADGARLLKESLGVRPKQPAVLSNLGEALLSLGRPDEALAAFDALLALQPQDADAHQGRGNALQGLKRYGEAIASYQQVMRLKPSSQAYNNAALAHLALHQLDDALAALDKALALQPDNVAGLINRAHILQTLGRYEEALASCDKAIALKPGRPEGHNGRGLALQTLGRHEEALASFGAAAACQPPFIQALYNKATLLRELKRYEEALSAYERVYALNPEFSLVAGGALYAMQHGVIWQGLEAVYADIVCGIEAGRLVTSPFPVLASPLAPLQLKRCAEIFVNGKYPPSASPLWTGEAYRHEKIRLGYFSSDFHGHATAQLIAEVLERHDRSRFEVIAFSFGLQKQDSMRKRIEAGVDRFVDIGGMPDREAAQAARSMEIDIALDLKGFSQHMRLGLFAQRMAPVQVNYLVFPGTSGAPYMDYIIGDSVLVPEGHDGYYSEKLVRLPHSYQPNDSTKIIAPLTLTRKEAGLPEQGFVFCCFNNTFKITPAVFDIWMRLLHKVPGSVLWLLRNTPESSRKLADEARQRGIDPARLVFAERAALPDHLARHGLADLFLDTLYCNAHTTASDALWARLPVLTCMGQTFASRVAASLLYAVGMPETVAHSHEEYEAKAHLLATRPEMLAAAKAKLQGNLASTPLFDTARYTRHLEAAFMRMAERANAGLSPDAFTVYD